MKLTVNFPHSHRISTLAGPADCLQTAESLAQAKTFHQDFLAAFRDCVAREDFTGLSEALNTYSIQAKNRETQNDSPKNIFGPRTKYYSSILEEIPVFMALPYVRDFQEAYGDAVERHVSLGGKNCAIRVGADPQANIFVETKRIDFCLSVACPTIHADVPLLGLEIKKYVDKTMFGTILETYKSLRTFRPRTYYGFLAEYEARETTVAQNSEMFDREFFLTGKSRNRTTLQPFLPASLHKLQAMLAEQVPNMLAEISTPQP